tara:strand:+ start:3217 stop:3486 length:270 start_codon:yes stop_codon:yes gene_type:complete
MSVDEAKANIIPVYLKDINSYYSFLSWLEVNFEKDIKNRSDLPTLMLIILKKITDDASKQLKFHERKAFLESSERLKERLKSNYVKKDK